jgi:Domain of unknown function (DUF5668)
MSDGPGLRARLTPQVFVGIAFIVIGVATALETLGIADATRYLHWWPAFLIGLGLVKLTQAQTGPGLFGAGFWLLVGSWLLADNLGFDVPEIWEAWPVLLILAGLVVIWHATRRVPSRPSGETDPTVNMLAIMAGVTRRSLAKTFRGGEATAIMGGCEIDLRDAALDPAGATIDVFAFWGGIEIKVPQGWRVENRVFALMAGAEDSTKGTAPAGAPTLVVRGLVVMGGVEIKN